MEESSRKRSRKSKLIPRDYLDSDDENIAEMQEQIEATLAKIKNKSILERLNIASTSKPLEFSIKVEVEEFIETNQNENLNIKIDSVTSLCGTTAPPVPILRYEPDVERNFSFTEQAIISEIEKLSQETNNYADKLIGGYVKNYFAKRKFKITKQHHVDVKIQATLRTKWTTWRRVFPDIRGVPLFYKCYICNLAWWYLCDFREHTLKHNKSLLIAFESKCHECNIIAFMGRKPEIRDIKLDSNCWRCDKDATPHMIKGNGTIMKYKCNGCTEKFHTCGSLAEHEANCPLYRNAIQAQLGINMTETFACNQCPIKCWSEDDISRHMILRHSVRTDVPVDWTLRFCTRCNIAFQSQALHDCPFRPMSASCEHCLEKFKSHFFLSIHLYAAQYVDACRVCNESLSKQCMELQHLLKHTVNYTASYKCIYCKDSIYFLDLTSANKHKASCHKKELENTNIGSCFEMVAVPTRLIQSHPTYQYHEAERDIPQLAADTTCQEQLDFLDEIDKLNKAKSKAIEVDTLTINAEDMKKTIECIDKSPTNPENITETSDKSDSTQKEIKITSYDNTKSVDMNEKSKLISHRKRKKKLKSSQKLSNKLEKAEVDLLHEANDKLCSIQSREKDNAGETSPMHVDSNVVPSDTQSYNSGTVNFDPTLIIKQECTDDNEVPAHTQSQPEQSLEIEIKNVFEIKQEIMDTDPQEDISESYENITQSISCNETQMNKESDCVGIKEEFNDTSDYNDELIEECLEGIQYIKEESPDDFESDLIILEPNNSAEYASGYDHDPNTNDGSSVVNDNINMQTLEPEIDIVHHTCYGKKIYKCNKCPFQGYHYPYKMHLKEEGHRRSRRKCLRKTCPRSDNDTTQYTCTKCATAYPSFYKYIMHFRKVHDYKPLCCPKCFRVMMNVQTLQGHVQTHIKDNFVSIYVIKTKDEGDYNKHQCKLCSQRVNICEFFPHWESHLEITKDSDRKQEFLPEMESKQELKKMLMLLQGIESEPDAVKDRQDKFRYCNKCERRFERKNECKRHFIEHLLVDAYQERHKYGFLKCQICGQDFYTSERYKRHMREHGSLPLYKCELCDKAFSDSSNFTKHKKVHNLSVLICDICGKKFTGKQFLEKHMQMHQVTKPFVCEECNKVFYTESSYKKHMSRGQVRYKCPSCNVFFPCLRDKWDHMWEVHKERKFLADCPLCKKSFRKHQDVKQHIRRMHREANFKYVPNKTPLIDQYQQPLMAKAGDAMSDND